MGPNCKQIGWEGWGWCWGCWRSISDGKVKKKTCLDYTTYATTAKPTSCSSSCRRYEVASWKCSLLCFQINIRRSMQFYLMVWMWYFFASWKHKPTTQKGTSADNVDHYILKVMDFFGRTRKLEDDILRLDSWASVLDLRVECQDLERFSVINRFARFHSRGQHDRAETSSSSDTTF